MIVEQPVLDPATALFQSFSLKIAGTQFDSAQIIGSGWPDVVAALGASKPGDNPVGLRVSRIIAQPVDGHTPCTRALELPRIASLPRMAAPSDLIRGEALGTDSPSLPSGFQNRWLRFDTGRANRIRLMLGIDAATVKRLSIRGGKPEIFIRELTAGNALIRETPLNALLPPTAGATNQPAATWLDPAGPWATRVVEIAAFLLSQQLGLIFVELVPRPNTVKIEIAIDSATFRGDVPGKPVVSSLPISGTPAGAINTEIVGASILRTDAAGNLIVPSLPISGAAAGATGPAAAGSFGAFVAGIGSALVSSLVAGAADSRLVVGAIEVCPASETDRYQNAVQIQLSTIATIKDYLNGGTPVPLLDPNTVYTIGATYNAIVTETDGSTNSHGGVQKFQFKTDSNPPAKLDPWVLCGAPDLNEKYVFYQDPVQILFNDNSIIQLFGKYGYQLKMNLHAADGFPEPSMGAPVGTSPVPGIGQATYDAMLELTKSGALPCIGSATQYQNQMFTAPVQLRPLMAYTLDLVTSPAQTVTDPTILPLYRRAFSTSKYPSMTALAKDLGVCVVKHRALKSKLGFPLAAGKTVVPDQDIQDKFMAAGEQALPPPSQNCIVIYWAQNAGTGPYLPHAILLDCTEPLWRARAEPTFQQADPNDPSFKMVTISAATALEVREITSSAIGGFIVSPSGTRTIAMFANGFVPQPQGTKVTLALHRPSSAFYSLAQRTDNIVILPIAPAAPWESDHV
jgi:hypothetical protein